MSNTRSAALITVIPDMISMEVELSPDFLGEFLMEPVHPQLLSRSDFQLLEHHCPIRLQTHLSGLRDVLWYWNHRRLRHHHCGHRSVESASYFGRDLTSYTQVFVSSFNTGSVVRYGLTVTLSPEALNWHTRYKPDESPVNWIFPEAVACVDNAPI